MKRWLLIAAVAVAMVSCGRGSLTSYVNPMVGTDGHGHTFPGAIVPFGMIQPSPDTRLGGWDGCSGYHYSDDTIYGFSHTHLSGTGVEDYCDLLLMPVEANAVAGLQFGDQMRDGYRRGFQHRNETAHPGYYKVLLEYRGAPATIVELSCDRRVAYHRYTYLQNLGNAFVVDLRHRDVLLGGRLMLCDSLLVGYRESSSWNPDQLLFFAIKGGTPFDRVVFSDDSTQAIVYVKDAKSLELQVAISGVDIEGAIGNLNSAQYADIDQARRGADAEWEDALSKLKVEDGSKEQRACFYTALYHCMTAPYLWSDSDGRYRGHDREVHRVDEGREVYTVFSLWDTYRALHPLLTQIEPERTLDFVYSAMKQYEQSNELSMWPLAGHETHCMIGYHAAPMLLEAYRYLAQADGTLVGYGPSELLAAMVATSNRTPEHRAYAEQGFLSSEVDNESVSKTLEYAYDDWCIAQMAEIAHDTLAARSYWLRSQSWQNLLDADGFMHPRRNGGFLTPFDPTEVNNHFTEANSWQYSTYVPHDVEMWVEQIGGEAKALVFLDSLFEGGASLSGRAQSDITGLIGMYAHGNEPSHHAAWLYALLGHPEKTDHYVHRILNELYSSEPDGLCGNEDCGQMSAWYVLSALGWYEVCPGSGWWVKCEPLLHAEQAFDWSIEVDPKVLRCPDTLRMTPCPTFSTWQMQGKRDQVRDTMAQWSGRLPSYRVSHIEVRTPTDKKVSYLTQPAPQYTENGPSAMVDRIFGTANYRIGGWQGWQQDMVAVVELDRSRTIRSVGVDCLENMRSWIFFPTSVSVECSEDGQNWQPFGEVENSQFKPLHKRQEESLTHTFEVSGSAKARYVRVRAHNFGALPDWHISAGEQAWLFVDEIIIN